MKLFIDDGGPANELAPVVLVHGLAGESGIWSAQLEHLRKTRRALAPDLPGHGQSPRATSYSVQSCTDALAEALPQLPKFWLVGHSFSGAVVSRFAGEHPSKLAGVIFVDAVGDVSNASAEVRAWFAEQDKDMTWPKLEKMFLDMLGPKARPATRERMLQAARKLDLAAWQPLRASMADNPARELLAKFDGPKWAIEVDEPITGRSACSLPNVRRLTVPDVCHWLMLDDPDATNRALDEALHG
jgi:pimeloyl-ACP methyl ester carboxylesterase